MVEQKFIEKVNLSQQVVMPLHRELIKSRSYKLPLVPLSPFAVYVRKMASTQRHNWLNNLSLDKQFIKELCGTFSTYHFLVNFQYKNYIDFNQIEMNYLEAVQKIPKLLYVCMNEKSSNQTSQEFETQLLGWQKRNPNKIIVPVIEAYTNERLKKISVMKKNNVRRCAVISRSYINEEDRANFSRVLANLRIAGIYSFVFGVNPKKWKKTDASMLLPSLQYKANAISSWIAWGGEKTPMEFLCSNWLYKNPSLADNGLATYNGSDRKTLLTGNTSIEFNTALSQIDIVNQSGLLARSFTPLQKVQFESLFN